MEKLRLFTMGIVTTNTGRKFTRLMGGFGEGNASMTIKQIGQLTGLEDRTINQTINRNIKHFEENVHITDVKNSITESDPVYEVLKSQGYSNQSLSNSKNIYILSEAGFLLYLKFAEGDKAISLYKDFIEDYFKIKAENKTMKSTIQEEIKELENEKYKLAGIATYNPIEDERVEA